MQPEDLEFEVNDLVLRGQLYKPAAPAKKIAVLFLHGWTGTPNNDAAAILAENGYTAMTFSLSGHNDSEGRIEDQTRQKSLQEVMAAYDLFISKLPADIRIVAAGTSYGSYMSAVLTDERPLVAVSLRVPANYPDAGFTEPQIGKGHYNEDVNSWRKEVLDFSQTKSLKAIHEFKGSVQVFEAEEDELVPHQCVQNYVDAVGDKSKLDYHVMKGWPHSLGADQARNKQYQELLLNWLEQQV